MFNDLIFYLGNWILLAMVGICILFMIRIYLRPFYDRLYLGLHFRPELAIPALAGFILILYREALVVPFARVEYWIPQASFSSKLAFWLATTHFISISIFAVFIFYLWRKYDALLPAVYSTWLALAVIEVSFIPQHLIMIQNFIGLEWYLPFIASAVPFFLERKDFTFKKKGLFFVAIGLVLQYSIILLYPWSMSVYDPAIRSFGLNYALFNPDPPLITWIFTEANYVVKAFFLAGLSFIGWTWSWRDL